MSLYVIEDPLHEYACCVRADSISEAVSRWKSVVSAQLKVDVLTLDHPDRITLFFEGETMFIS